MLFSVSAINNHKQIRLISFKKSCISNIQLLVIIRRLSATLMPIEINSIFIGGVTKIANNIGAWGMFQEYMSLDMLFSVSAIITSFAAIGWYALPGHSSFNHER